MIWFKLRATRSAGIEMAISMHKPSRLKSSSMFNFAIERLSATDTPKSLMKNTLTFRQ